MAIKPNRSSGPEIVRGPSQRWALIGGTAILPDRILPDAYVEMEGGNFRRVGRIPKRIPNQMHTVDVSGQYVSPGLIDLHVHGGAGADFMDGTPEAIATASRAHLQHGTTALFPTSTTGDAHWIHAMLDAVAALKKEVATPRDAMESDHSLLPTIPGIHLYGPYFAPDKSGCHKKSGCRLPQREEFESYFRTGLVRIATCAAELEGASEFYRYAKRRGCLITCGHSNASWSEMAAAHRLGMSHVDHFWCAMSNVASVRSRLGTPMQGSMLEFVLAHPTMSTEVIADGCHLAPELLQFAWQMKGPERLCIVTDTNRALDMPPGRYAFGHPNEEVWMVSDGHVGRTFEGGLASAIQGMDYAIRHLARNTKIPLHEIVRMASLTPAERTGMDDRLGSLEVGKQADVLVWTKKLELRSIYLSPAGNKR